MGSILQLALDKMHPSACWESSRFQFFGAWESCFKIDGGQGKKKKKAEEKLESLHGVTGPAEGAFSLL